MSTKQTRRRFSGEFKFKVVVDALKERHSLAELSQKDEVRQVMISLWNSEFLEAGSNCAYQSQELIYQDIRGCQCEAVHRDRSSED
jgi:transposase-like protein